jgi:hypothetical protein
MRALTPGVLAIAWEFSMASFSSTVSNPTAQWWDDGAGTPRKHDVLPCFQSDI